MSQERHRREVEAALRALTPEGSPTQHAAYIGGGTSRLVFLGLRVPQRTAVARAGFSFLTPVGDADAAAVLKTWDYIWRTSPYYEALSLPLAYYAQKRHWPQLPTAFPRIRGWVGRVDNWALADGLSSILARTLEMDRGLVLPTLATWNEARDPWRRRLSLVSLLYYSAARDPASALPFKILQKFVENCLDDAHYYVQKGVGWTLREMGHIYPAETEALLRKQAPRLSAHAFAAATEKLDGTTKSALKAARRTARRDRAW